MRRRVAVVAIAAVAWGIAIATASTSPASFDFVAIYASARLVATGQPAAVADRDAILGAEHAALPERTEFLNNPNPPVVSLLLAPLGLLPYRVAYAAMVTLLVLALAASAHLLAPLVPAGGRARLYPFAMLAPTSLVALVEGQTTPLVLLAVAGSLRAPPPWSGVLLGATALRPQFLPLFAAVALLDRERRWPFVGTVAALALLSLALIGPAGVPGYVALLGASAAELRPVDIGAASLVRRVLGGEDAAASFALSAVALVAGLVVLLRTPSERRTAVASAWSLAAAPHALLHDGVLCYPAVATAAATARRAWAAVASGVATSVVHQAGAPVASLYLVALSLCARVRRR